MTSLDETDLEILSLLAADARRPYSDIGDEVGLSGPAVSDRVARLSDAGVIERFTVEVDRTQLRGGVPVFVRVRFPTDSLDPARAVVRDAKSVEHLFVTAEGELWFFARVGVSNVREWVAGLFTDIPMTEYAVTLVDDVEWTPSVEGIEFALTCAECDNTVDSEGETAHIDGTVYHFCCPSCLARFEERYSRLEEGV